MSLAHSLAKGLKTEGDTEGSISSDFDSVRGGIYRNTLHTLKGAVCRVSAICSQNQTTDLRFSFCTACCMN